MNVAVTARRLAALAGGLADAEEQTVDLGLTPRTRWWQGAGADVVRVADGDWWIVLPRGAWRHPPFLANLLRNAPDLTIPHIEAKGGVVLPAEYATRLELRLCGVKR